MEDLKLLEQRIGYIFTRREFLFEALSHRSWLNEGARNGSPDNERLEFFGDALVDFLVAEYLLHRHPLAREGTLSKLRAELVSEVGLALVAADLGLGKYLRLGHGEDISGGRNKPSLLANAVEALVGALYLDGGLPAARLLLSKYLFPRAEELHLSGIARQDRKSALQEFLQARGAGMPVYQVLDESGPSHQRSFVVSVSVNATVVGTGSGASKKAAEQAAAAAALTKLADQGQVAG